MNFIITAIKILVHNITHKNRGNISISKKISETDVIYTITIKRK